MALNAIRLILSEKSRPGEDPVGTGETVSFLIPPPDGNSSHKSPRKSVGLIPARRLYSFLFYNHCCTLGLPRKLNKFQFFLFTETGKVYLTKTTL